MDNVFMKELYPYVEKCFSEKNNIQKFISIVSKYIDKNSEVLTDIGPFNVAYFSKEDSLAVFNLIGITEQEVMTIQKKTKVPALGAGIKKVIIKPFNILMVMIIKYAYKINNDSLKYTSKLYFALSMYQYFFKQKYFKFTPNRNVMEYTINNLSMKYKVKQSGNLMNAWYETANGVAVLYEKELSSDNFTDKDVYIYIQYTFTRLNAFMKNIYDAFIKNHNEGKYMNPEVDIVDEDNFREAQSSTATINKLTENVVIKLISEGPPVKLITTAAKNNKVSINELRNYISRIVIDENKDDMHSLIESILFMYIFDNNGSVEEINSDKFAFFCLEIYKRAMTSNKNAVNIKNILEKWMQDLDAYKKTQRFATINSFKRAIYTFFVLAIMHYNITR